MNPRLRRKGRRLFKLYLAGLARHGVGGPARCGARGSRWPVSIRSPGSVVSNLTLVTVTFTQPVVGVQAEDLILNGSSGTNVTGSGAVYTFGFSPPSPGVVEASWNGGHNITDLSGNRLDDLGASTVWEYTLIDTVAPAVTRD